MINLIQISPHRHVAYSTSYLLMICPAQKCLGLTSRSAPMHQRQLESCESADHFKYTSQSFTRIGYKAALWGKVTRREHGPCTLLCIYLPSHFHSSNEWGWSLLGHNFMVSIWITTCSIFSYLPFGDNSLLVLYSILYLSRMSARTRSFKNRTKTQPWLLDWEFPSFLSCTIGSLHHQQSLSFKESPTCFALVECATNTERIYFYWSCSVVLYNTAPLPSTVSTVSTYCTYSCFCTLLIVSLERNRATFIMDVLVSISWGFHESRASYTETVYKCTSKYAFMV